MRQVLLLDDDDDDDDDYYYYSTADCCVLWLYTGLPRCLNASLSLCGSDLSSLQSVTFTLSVFTYLILLTSHTP